jgi:hypothetical protein
VQEMTKRRIDREERAEKDQKENKIAERGR